MKAEELMIGDYVKLKDAKLGNINFVGPVVQIKSITGRHVLVPNAKGLLEDVTEEYLLPVPLTPEILEKNGFEDYDSYATLDTEKYRVIYAFDGFLTIVDDDNQRKVSYLECDYVHHLQHTLRLCRIEKEIEL